ncbi:MAG: hypothetical protein WC477_03100 [Patescibacteria group bacterium]
MTARAVTDEQLGAFARRQQELFHRVVKGVVPCQAAMDAMQRLFDPPKTITVHIKTSAQDIIANAKSVFERADIPFTFFEENLFELAQHDLELVRGRTCQVLIHKFDHDWVTSDGREFQKAKKFDGNVAAYLLWVTEALPNGWSVSIPKDDSRLFSDSGNCLYAPRFYQDGDCRAFHLIDIRSKWLAETSLIAFRAI